MTATPWLGKPSTFRQAHPAIRSLKFEGRQRGDVSGGGQREEHYSESNLPRAIPCSNRRCQQGGYDLSAYIITIEHGRTQHIDGQMYCNGHEGTPKGKRRGHPCSNALSFSISATYEDKA